MREKINHNTIGLSYEGTCGKRIRPIPVDPKQGARISFESYVQARMSGEKPVFVYGKPLKREVGEKQEKLSEVPSLPVGEKRVTVVGDALDLVLGASIRVLEGVNRVAERLKIPLGKKIESLGQETSRKKNTSRGIVAVSVFPLVLSSCSPGVIRAEADIFESENFLFSDVLQKERDSFDEEEIAVQSERILSYLEKKAEFDEVGWELGTSADGNSVLVAKLKGEKGNILSLVYPDAGGKYREVSSINPDDPEINMYLEEGRIFLESGGSLFERFEQGWSGVQKETFDNTEKSLPEVPFFFYYAKKGESPESISQKYGVSPDSVSAAMEKAKETPDGMLLTVEEKPKRSPYVGLKLPEVDGMLGDLRQIEVLWQVPDAAGNWKWSDEIIYRPYAVPMHPNVVFVHRGGSYLSEHIENLEKGNEVTLYRDFSDPKLAGDKSLAGDEGFFESPEVFEVERVLIIDTKDQEELMREWKKKGYKVIITCHPSDYQGEDPPQRMVVLLVEKKADLTH